MLPHIFLCRHGETAWNAERRIQGQVEIPLNRRGREQAARNGAVLRERLGAGAPGWRFLASPMRRTRETMRILREAVGLAPEDYATDARLMELNFGDWQGATLAEIGVRDPQALAARERAKWDFVPTGPDAESYAMLERRMAPVFASLREPTVLVAHGGIVRCFLRRYGELGPDAAAHALIVQDRVLEYREGTIGWI